MMEFLNKLRRKESVDKVEVEFKFKVGDIVVSAATAHLSEEQEIGMWLDPQDTRYLIQERLYQQCYNTFQIHYDCRPIARNGFVGKEIYRFTEPMLALSVPFKTRAELKKLRKAAEEKEEK